MRKRKLDDRIDMMVVKRIKNRLSLSARFKHMVILKQAQVMGGCTLHCPRVCLDVAHTALSAKKGKKNFKKKFTVNKNTGKITVKKGLKKGKYKIRIQVTDPGNAQCEASSKTVTVTITVK